MAMIIIFTIFGLFWLATTLASITYLIFKNSKNLTRQLEEHPPFWLQDYYSFLNRYHKPLLVGSIAMGIGLTVWGINSQEEKYIDCSFYEIEPKITIKRRTCQKRQNQENMYVERSATPYGGTEDLARYIQEYQDNPTGEMGTVYVEFFVQEDGSLRDISILGGISSTLDNEAIRLIEKYPQGWQSALYHGKAIKQRVVYPVQF